jgi:predicted transcriptional regulator
MAISPRLSYRVPSKHLQELTALARKQKRNKSLLLRDALSEYLDRQKTNPPSQVA